MEVKELTQESMIKTTIQYLDSPWVVSPNFKGFSVFLSSNLYLSAG
jgi:hypothetical protein